VLTVVEIGYDAYPAMCCFPGCTQAARLADDGEDSLCAEHERLRYYLPDEFAREWSELAPSA
jgi:hypothetical protein